MIRMTNGLHQTRNGYVLSETLLRINWGIKSKHVQKKLDQKMHGRVSLEGNYSARLTRQFLSNKSFLFFIHFFWPVAICRLADKFNFRFIRSDSGRATRLHNCSRLVWLSQTPCRDRERGPAKAHRRQMGCLTPVGIGVEKGRQGRYNRTRCSYGAWRRLPACKAQHITFPLLWSLMHPTPFAYLYRL